LSGCRTFHDRSEYNRGDLIHATAGSAVAFSIQAIVMFHIKICGITCVEDALAAARAGADAIGLNFYPASPRFVHSEQAQAIVAASLPGVIKVGLFVGAPPGDVCEAFDRLRLDLIQLHGDEPPEYLTRLGGRPVMRAFRLGPAGLGPISRYLEGCGRLGCLPRLVLLDAYTRGVYGGTGELADWAAAAEYAGMADAPPLVLAGGLTPQNIAAAIRSVHPAAVDTASGVETSPGRKDPAAVTAFVRAAREAFAL
jgi:phosphoribosylanthranilate isomerase